MLLKKTILIISVLTCVSALWAGDTASFVDLGFSPDGKTYMFGQYGVLSQSWKPWAEIFVVDVRSNDFVKNGRISHTQNSSIKPGQDGSGILYQLINSNQNLVSRYNINFQNQGLPLYISRDENPVASGESIEFRDFITDNFYKAQLFSTVYHGNPISSSFYISLESRSKSGQVKTYNIGNPQIKRPRITSYNIKKVLIDAAGESLIFVIEMKRTAENSHDIRYMIETLRL